MPAIHPSASEAQNRRLSFAGIFLPPRSAPASLDTIEAVGEAIRDGDLTAFEKLPSHDALPQPIFADAEGGNWHFRNASDGRNIAVEWKMPPSGGEFISNLRLYPGPHPDPIARTAHQQILATTIATVIAQQHLRGSQRADDSPSPHDAGQGHDNPQSSSDAERLYQSLLRDAIKGMASQILQGKTFPEILESLRLTNETSSLWNNLGYGAFHQLMGAAITGFVRMKLSEVISRLWQVEDSDSVGEQLAHHLAFDLFWKMKDALLSGSPLKELPFLSPTSGAEWKAWFNAIFNGVGSSASFPIAHLGSSHAAAASCGVFTTGASTVTIETIPAVRLGDKARLDLPPDEGTVVAAGFPTVTIEGKPVAVAQGSDFILGNATGTMAPILTGAAKTFVGFPADAPQSLPAGAPADTAAAAEAVRKSDFFKFLEPLLGTNKAGQYTALFGSIVLGSPEFPGDGTCRDPEKNEGKPDFRWLIPDSFFGYDMSAYYISHDANFETTPSVAGEEGGAFASGVMGASGIEQLPIQIICSSATTIANVLDRIGGLQPKARTWPPRRSTT